MDTSGETLRKLVEEEGHAVLKAFREGALPIAWTAKDCVAELGKEGSPTRVYFGCDGVMAPMVTAGVKAQRRLKTKGKRWRCGRKCRALRRAKAGADQKYKEFEIVTYYDEPKKHRPVLGTKGNCEEAGRLMHRLAGRIDLPAAEEKVGNVDGAPQIRLQVEGRNLPRTNWAWIFTTWRRTCTMPGRCTARPTRRALSGRRTSCTRLSTAATV